MSLDSNAVEQVRGAEALHTLCSFCNRPLVCLPESAVVPEPLTGSLGRTAVPVCTCAGYLDFISS